MKKTLTAVSLVVLSGVPLIALQGCGTAMAQSPGGNDDSGKRSLRVTGTSVIYGKPDFATINLGCSRTATKVSDAKKACDTAMQRVYQAVRNAGVKAEDIQTTTYQMFVVPAQEKTARPAQWKVVNQIEIKVRAVETVSGVLDTAVSNGASNVSDVQFGIEKLGELRAKAREMAVKAAREKAEQLAKLNGVSLGPVISIIDGADDRFNVMQSGRNAYADGLMGGESGGSALSGGKIAVDAQELIEYSIR